MSDEDVLSEKSAASENSEEDSDGLPVATVPMPTFSLGHMAPVVAAKKRVAPQKKRAKEELDQDEFDGRTGGNSSDVVDTSFSEAEVHDKIEEAQDTLLKQVIRALDCSPPCLLGLLPATTFQLQQKVGHQLKGATWLLYRLYVFLLRNQKSKGLWHMVY